MPENSSSEKSNFLSDEDSTYEDSDDEEKYPDTIRCRSATQLTKRLRKELIRSQFDKTAHDFVPEGVVDKLVTREEIQKCMKATPAHTTLVGYTFQHAKKAFAISTWANINTHVAMNWFMTKSLTDKDLPFRELTAEWTRSSWRPRFFDEQWKFCAPIFDTMKYTLDFEEGHILPILSVTRVGGSGAFGEVSQYKLHENHMKPELLNRGVVAVKEIKAGPDTQEVAAHWVQEVRALRMMNDLKQEHIVKFITAFRRRRRDNPEEHYVMFEWADGGNLQDLWRKTPTPNLSGSLLKDATRQILGLATALSAAHNLNNTEASYRHGDLKPENILVFTSEDGSLGTFKIGDWGEAKYHKGRTEMRSRKTTAKYGTRRYEAPEVVTGLKSKLKDQSEKRRSRLYDVWAMGCITLECIVWLLYGLDGIKRLQRDVPVDEAFYQITDENGRKIARVHDAVVRWMDHMSQKSAYVVGTTAIGDLLELVRSSLLVVKLPRRMGSFLPSIEETFEAEDSHQGSYLSSGTGQPAQPDFEGAINSLDISDTSPARSIPTFSLTGPDAEANEPVQPEPEVPGPSRCLASEFKNRMDQIYHEDDVLGYWETHKRPPDMPFGLAGTGSLQISHRRDENESGLKAMNYDPSDLDEHDWRPKLDTAAASKLFSGLRENGKLEEQRLQQSSKICDQCKEFTTGFGPTDSISYTLDKLKASAEAAKCDVCILLWRICNNRAGSKVQTVQFVREGALVKLEHNHETALLLVQDPTLDLTVSSDYQIGFIEMPTAGQSTHLGVLRSWLSDCDTNHELSCKPMQRANGSGDSSTARVPTRLIEVGSEGSHEVFLRETIELPDISEKEQVQWIALSHKWGEKHFSTTQSSLISHKQGLRLDRLPPTFRDAVVVTRALGLKYLWIDSICIIQGDDGDFETEAKSMEDVYSGAYCIIAASRATNHYSGFLQPRNQRNYVGLKREEKNGNPFYLCENIDDFQSHVLDGDLNSRGWVLQEHALARRTIFFTEHQTYFECGMGVRCETSTRLENAYAEFLGDANFPDVLYNATQGDKITRIQELYKKYSKLGLTKDWDRPVAIGGLQQRLLRTLRVAGDFGILDEGATRGLLRRTLLWRRHPDELSMSRIDFKHARTKLNIPSWSWMAYTGRIDYLKIEFGTYSWENIQSPWTPNESRWWTVNAENAETALFAPARRYDLGAAKASEVEIILDASDYVYNAPKSRLPPDSLCVVLGIAKGKESESERKHCVIIIKPTGEQDGTTVYERIGAGFLPGKCLAPRPMNVQTCFIK